MCLLIKIIFEIVRMHLNMVDCPIFSGDVAMIIMLRLALIMPSKGPALIHSVHLFQVCMKCLTLKLLIILDVVILLHLIQIFKFLMELLHIIGFIDILNFLQTICLISLVKLIEFERLHFPEIIWAG